MWTSVPDPALASIPSRVGMFGTQKITQVPKFITVYEGTGKFINTTQPYSTRNSSKLTLEPVKSSVLKKSTWTGTQCLCLVF